MIKNDSIPQSSFLLIFKSFANEKLRNWIFSGFTSFLDFFVISQDFTVLSVICKAVPSCVEIIPHPKTLSPFFRNFNSSQAGIGTKGAPFGAFWKHSRHIRLFSVAQQNFPLLDRGFISRLASDFLFKFLQKSCPFVYSDRPRHFETLFRSFWKYFHSVPSGRSLRKIWRNSSNTYPNSEIRHIWTEFCCAYTFFLLYF